MASGRIRACPWWKARRRRDRKSTRLNSSHGSISYAVFCLKKKKNFDGNYVIVINDSVIHRAGVINPFSGYRPPVSRQVLASFFFFFNDPATTEIYTLSLHDALPI